jgi:alpha-L-fucosidase
MWDTSTTYPLVKGLQPQIIINNRLEMSSFEQWGHQGGLAANEDYYTPEQTIGAYNDKAPWETCMTIGTQWAWKPDDQIKSPAEVIYILARCVGGDGNLLFNVGPMPDGRIEPRQVEVLKEVGAWMDKNGESIYGTRGGPWKPTHSVASTRKADVVYLHVLRGKSHAVELPDIACKVKSASLLNGGNLDFAQHDGRLTVTVPMAQRSAGDTVVKLKLDRPAMELPAMEILPTIKTTSSNVYQKEDSNYGPQMAFDEDDETRWATDDAVKQAWIAADFGKPDTFSGVHIAESFNRVQKFEFQYRAGEEWKTIFEGTTLGGDLRKTFDPVTAREFRLNIVESKGGPTISEIQLVK